MQDPLEQLYFTEHIKNWGEDMMTIIWIIQLLIGIVLEMPLVLFEVVR